MTFRQKLIIRVEQWSEVDVLIILYGEYGTAGSDLTSQRQTSPFLGVVTELNRTRHVRLAGDQPFFLKSFEVTHHTIGRADAKVGTDFTHGGGRSHD